MLQALTTRTSIVAAATLLLLLGPMPASSAVATGTTTVTIYFDGEKRGNFSHIDDGDHFAVCDLRSDSAGVSGILLEEEPITNDLAIVEAADDGGDAGCDSFTYNIIPEANYIMRVCWNGSHWWQDGCTEKRLIE